MFISWAQRLAVMAWLFICIAVLGWAWHALGPLATVAIALPLLGGYVFWVLLALSWMRAATRANGEAAPPWRDMLRAWAGEVRTAPLVFAWHQPFRWNAEPDALTPPTPGAPHRGVLLVHGYVCNRAFWNPLLRHLKREGVSVIALNGEPPFARIEAWADAIEAAVARLAAHTGCAPVIVAHSMGGLAVRAWAARGGGANAERLHRLITLGSPHHGTAVAALAATPNGAQMRRGNAWLNELQAAFAPELAARTTCVVAGCDQIVFPISSAELPGATVLRVPACGHVALARQAQVWELVDRALKAR